MVDIRLKPGDCSLIIDMMTLRLWVTCFLLIFSVTSYGQEQVKILYIGNSLTYSNNLPKLVEREAQKIGFAVSSTTIAKPNYALIDHWREGNVQKLIRSEGFDYVIVQQGPSSQSEGRKMLIEDGQKIVDLSNKYGSVVCFYMVWPSRQYFHTFDEVIESHKMAAKLTASRLIPVGEVWQQYIDNTGSFDYYGPDGFHPSLKGSQVAAELIVTTLFGR